MGSCDTLLYQTATAIRVKIARVIRVDPAAIPFKVLIDLVRALAYVSVPSRVFKLSG